MHLHVPLLLAGRTLRLLPHSVRPGVLRHVQRGPLRRRCARLLPALHDPLQLLKQRAPSAGQHQHGLQLPVQEQVAVVDVLGVP